MPAQRTVEVRINANGEMAMPLDVFKQLDLNRVLQSARRWTPRKPTLAQYNSGNAAKKAARGAKR